MSRILPGLTGDTLDVVSRWAWAADFGHLDLAAVSGQASHFSRSGPRTALDSLGVSRTLVEGQPAHEWVDLDSDSVRERPGLLMGSTDRLWYDMLLHPTSMTLYAEFIERGSLAAGGAVLYVGNDGNTGARILIESTGTQYRVTYTDGTTTRTSTLAGTAPVTGQRVEIRATASVTGAVQIAQRINGGTETQGPLSTGLTFPSAWSDARVYVGSRGNASASSLLVLRAVIAHGTPTMAELEAVV